MFCYRCGAELDTGANFCRTCGTRVILPSSDSVSTKTEQRVVHGDTDPKQPVVSSEVDKLAGTVNGLLAFAGNLGLLAIVFAVTMSVVTLFGYGLWSLPVAVIVCVALAIKLLLGARKA